MLGLGLSLWDATLRGGSPLPVVEDQAISFGALTLSGAGGIIPTHTGTISSASITSGNALAHWQIALDGTITPTATGDTANLNGGPYTLGVSFNGGVDTAAITVNIDAAAYDVATAAELTSALQAAETANPALDYTIYVRDAANIAAVNLNSYTFSGTLVDANDGASGANYDYAAVASFTGGSAHVTARTAYAPQVSGKMRILGCTGVQVSKLRFMVPATTAQASFYQLEISRNATHPAEPIVIIRDNQFGAYDVTADTTQWGHCIYVGAADRAIIEDNALAGFYIGMSFASVRRGVARRNTLQRQLIDGIRGMGNAVADLVAAFTSERLEITGNKIWNMNEDILWAAAHADGIQFGTSSDEVDYDVFVKRNYIYLPTEPVGSPNQRSSQGCYLDDVPVGVEINGVIAQNFVVCSASAGITLYRGTLQVRNNTVLNDTLHSTHGGNVNRNANIRVNAGSGHVVYDNFASNIASGGGSFTQYGNILLDETALSGATSLYDNFTGPITVGTFGPSWTVRVDTAAHLVADIDGVFAPVGAGIGKGHLYDSLGAEWMTFGGAYINAGSASRQWMTLRGDYVNEG